MSYVQKLEISNRENIKLDTYLLTIHLEWMHITSLKCFALKWSKIKMGKTWFQNIIKTSKGSSWMLKNHVRLLNIYFVHIREHIFEIFYDSQGILQSHLWNLIKYTWSMIILLSFDIINLIFLGLYCCLRNQGTSMLTGWVHSVVI